MLDLLDEHDTATLLRQYYIKVNTATSQVARLDGTKHELHIGKDRVDWRKERERPSIYCQAYLEKFFQANVNTIAKS